MGLLLWKRSGLVDLYFNADFFLIQFKQNPSFLNLGGKPTCRIIFLSKCLKMQDFIGPVLNPYLEGVTILGLVDRSQDRLVDPEAHGGGDQSQGQVADYTENITAR